MPVAALASASAEEEAEDEVLRLLARKPLGSLKWVVVEESEEEPPPDHHQHQQQHYQQQQHQQYDRGGVAVARRPSTPRGPDGGLWSAATTPPRPRSPATTPPTASYSGGGGGGGGGSNGGSHNSSRRVYYLDVDKPARLVNDAIHQRALMTAGMAAGLGASPMRVLSGGARSAASSTSPLASDRGWDFAGGQGLGGGGGGRRGAGVWWRSWPALILLVLVGAAAGALFGLRSRVGMHMGLMLLAGAAAVVAGLLVWACCRHAEAEEEGEGQGEEGLGFVEGAAGPPGRNDRRRHYGSTLAGP